ncbi:cytosine permease [Chloroflexota bacterium]
MAKEAELGWPMEEYYDSPIPAERRQPIWHVWAAVVGFFFIFANIFVGGAIGAGMSLANAIWAVVIAVVIYAVLATIQGVMAQRTGLPLGQNIRIAFGPWGSYVYNLFGAFIGIAWYAITLNFTGLILEGLWGINYYLTVAVFGIIFWACVYYGFRPITIVGYIASIFAVVVGAMILTRGIDMAGGISAIAAVPIMGQPLPMAMGVVILLGAFIHGLTHNIQDWTRWGKSQGTMIAMLLPSVVLGMGFMFMLGVFSIKIIGQPDITQLGAAVGMLTLGGIMLLLLTWSTLNPTLYGSSMAFSSAFLMKRTHSVILWGVIGLALSLVRPFTFIQPWLIILGTVIPCAVGCIIAHYWLIHRGRYPDAKYLIPGQLPPEQMAKRNPVTIAVLIGFVVSVTLSFLDGNFRWFMPPVTGIVSALLITWLVGWVMKEKIEVPAEA